MSRMIASIVRLGSARSTASSRPRCEGRHRRRALARRTVLLLGALAMALPGCRSATGLTLLSLVGLSQKPVRLGLVADRVEGGSTDILTPLNPFGPYEPLRAALNDELKRPVGLGLCFGFLLEGYLRDGLFDLAVVTPAQYSALREPERYDALAIMEDPDGRSARPGLLVASTIGPVKSIADLKGRVVAFGPPADARRHQAALALLRDHGLAKTDLALEGLPVPGSLKTFPKSRDVCQSVLNNSSAAGFIDSADWDSLPASAAGNEPARDKFRVLGRTVELPDRMILCGSGLDAETRGRIARILFQLDQQRPDVLRSLASAGFCEPQPELIANCRRLGAAASPPAPATEPAQPGTPG